MKTFKETPTDYKVFIYNPEVGKKEWIYFDKKDFNLEGVIEALVEYLSESGEIEKLYYTKLRKIYKQVEFIECDL